MNHHVETALTTRPGPAALHGPRAGLSGDGRKWESHTHAGASCYRRTVMLPRLLPVAPDDIGDVSAAGRLIILKKLAKALRGERMRGKAGHWTYSLNRHIGLLQAFAAERLAYRDLTGRGAGTLPGRIEVRSDPS